MGRNPKWNSPTDSVRLPKHAISACLALARQLDDPKPVGDVKNNVQNPTDPYLLTSEGQGGTYRLLLDPPRYLPPPVATAIEEYCDRVFASLTDSEQVFLLARLVDELGVKVEA